MTNCQNQKRLPHEPQNFLALLHNTGALWEFFPFKSRTLTTQCAFWKQAFVKKNCCSNKKFCECLSYSCNEYQRLQACLLETGLFPSEVQSHSHKIYLFQWHFNCIVNARLSKPKLYFCWNYSNIVKFCTNLVSILFWKSNKMISNWEMWKYCFFWWNTAFSLLIKRWHIHARRGIARGCDECYVFLRCRHFRSKMH